LFGSNIAGKKFDGCERIEQLIKLLFQELEEFNTTNPGTFTFRHASFSSADVQSAPMFSSIVQVFPVPLQIDERNEIDRIRHQLDYFFNRRRICKSTESNTAVQQQEEQESVAATPSPDVEEHVVDSTWSPLNPTVNTKVDG